MTAPAAAPRRRARLWPWLLLGGLAVAALAADRLWRVLFGVALIPLTWLFDLLGLLLRPLSGG